MKWTKWNDPMIYLCVTPGTKFPIDPKVKAAHDAKLEQAKNILGIRYCLNKHRLPLIEKKRV